MLKISKVIFAILALIPILSFAHVETNIEMPKATHIIKYSQSHNEKLIRQYFKEDADIAVEIFKCESTLSNVAVGDAGKSIGLAQINTSVHIHDKELLKDPEYNLRVAHEIWKKQGWVPWTCGRIVGAV